MKRRDLLTGFAGAALIGLGAAVTAGWINPGGTDNRVETYSLPGIEAQGSKGGTVEIPDKGRVSFVEFFATWCTTCKAMMPHVKELHREVGEDVQFVSVTNEPLTGTVTYDDVSDWWMEHGGEWQVAHDQDLELTAALNAPGVPYAVILDRENRVVYRDGGYKEKDDLLPEIEAVLEA